MICSLRTCNGNLSTTVHYCREQYPNQRVPDIGIIQRIWRSRLELESFASWRRDCGRAYRRTLIEDNVLENIDNNSVIRVTSLSRNYDVSEKTIRRILHDNRMYPYHTTRVYALCMHEWFI